MVSNYRVKEKKPCAACGQSFHPWSSNPRALYCSRACYLGAGAITAPCSVCGVPVRRQLCKLRYRPTCSRDCFRRLMSRLNRGERCGTWKDGRHGRKVLSQARHKEYLRESGWPPWVSLPQAAVLNVLARVGLPLARAEIQATLPVRRSSLNRHLYILADGGLLLVTSGVRSCSRPYPWSLPLYTLSPLALSVLEGRLPCRPKTG